MLLSNEDKNKYMKRLLLSRLRILCNQGFYGTLLMHMGFVLDTSVKNVSANSKNIFINPEFLKRIDDKELDFVLIHEITHLSLKHNFRKRSYENKKMFDKAADIEVNSIILESFKNNTEAIAIDGQISKHLAPNGKEGNKYSTEELYKMLCDYSLDSNGISIRIEKDENGITKFKSSNELEDKNLSTSFDDHNKWEEDFDKMVEKEWEKYNLDACEVLHIKDPSNSRGTIPRYALREFQKLKEAKTDWRTLLNNFIQEEVNDYSFSPPDRRFDESPFFLPDFNDLDEAVKGVLFMIDTSGSMTDKEITQAYSEVKGAIDQFGGKLQGWLGFFDAAIVEPKEFVDDIDIIHPYGGGGTDYSIIFSYVRDKMMGENISSIVILTDGFCDFPNETAAMGIPVIWLINNDLVTPPWGKVARMLGEERSNKN